MAPRFRLVPIDGAAVGRGGVNLVQVNLGNKKPGTRNGNAFPHLKDCLLPPLDQSLSALLDDLHETGLLENTLVVMASEFGRTPKISTLPQHYKLPGRDHWGAVQTVFLAGAAFAAARWSARRTASAAIQRRNRTRRRISPRPSTMRSASGDDPVARRPRAAAPRLPRHTDRRSAELGVSR